MPPAWRRRGDKMFSINHIIWIVICIVFVIVFLAVFRSKKVSLTSVLTWACVICLLSELIKICSVVQVVSAGGTGAATPYITTNHLPFHLCSMQILLIFYARFSRNEGSRQAVLGFMYPTCLLGGAGAIVFPSIFNTTISVSEAFTHPVAYQTFIYHAMLLVVAIYIKMCGEVKMDRKTYLSSVLAYYFLMIISVYLNSILSTPVFDNGKLVSLEHAPNFMFTFGSPVPFAGFDSVGEWYIYILEYMVGIAAVFALFFFKEVFIPDRKKS